jgi:hypothetical protein
VVALSEGAPVQIIPRSEWGASYRAGFGARALPVGEAYLHHSATAPPANSPASERAAMRQIEQIGQQRFGAGFSYNLAVMPSGRVYEGCGVSRVGAHTRGRNTAALGIVLVGDYDTARVPAAAQQALVDLLRHAHASRWLTRPAFTGGHRDAPGASTACPGRHAHALISDLNRRATEDDNMPTPDEIARAVWTHSIAAREGVGPAPASAWLQHAAIHSGRASAGTDALIRDAVAKAAKESDANLTDEQVSKLAASVVVQLGRQAGQK